MRPHLSIGGAKGFKGLLPILNAIIALIKMCFPHDSLKDKKNLSVSTCLVSDRMVLITLMLRF